MNMVKRLVLGRLRVVMLSGPRATTHNGGTALVRDGVFFIFSVDAMVLFPPSVITDGASMALPELPQTCAVCHSPGCQPLQTMEGCLQALV